MRKLTFAPSDGSVPISEAVVLGPVNVTEMEEER